MLVKFKGDFFAPGGVLIEKGLREYNGPEDQLPSTAVIIDRQGRLPLQSNSPKAGHGAKPLEEQVLDLIPGAGVTHQIDNTPAPKAPELTAEQKAEKQKEVSAAAEAASKETAKAQEKADANLVTETKEGVKAAEAAAAKVEAATDPITDPFAAPVKPKK